MAVSLTFNVLDKGLADLYTLIYTLIYTLQANSSLLALTTYRYKICAISHPFEYKVSIYHP